MAPEIPQFGWLGCRWWVSGLGWLQRYHNLAGWVAVGGLVGGLVGLVGSRDTTVWLVGLPLVG